MPKVLCWINLFILFLTLTWVPCRASEPQHFLPVPGASRLEVNGTSNLHDWSAITTNLEGKVSWAGDKDSFFGSVQSALQVRIPVDSLQSGKRKMDAIMHKSLKHETHPDMTFELGRFVPDAGLDEEEAKPPGRRGALKGRLTVAGETLEVSVPVKVVETGASRLSFTGTASLKMSQFGIDPPRALLGTLRTGDDVTISFSWLLDRVQLGSD